MTRRRGQRLGTDPVERVSFRTYSNFSATGTTFAAPTISTVSIVPAFDARLAAIAEVYQFYRFTQLRVFLCPHINEVTADDVATSTGYLPRTPNTAPTTHVQVMAMPSSAYKGMGQTMPSKMSVPKSILLGDAPLKWFQSVAGTEDTQWEVQGVVYIAGTSTNATGASAVFYLEGICEFKGRSASQQTPLYKVPSIISSPEKTTPSGDKEVVLVGGYPYKLVKA